MRILSTGSLADLTRLREEEVNFKRGQQKSAKVKQREKVNLFLKTESQRKLKKILN